MRRRTKRQVLAAVVLSTALLSRQAAALGAADGGVVLPVDADEAEAELARDYDVIQASASDCVTACRALESMRRAAERLCTLDPGDRCAHARDKVHGAAELVRAACPTCAQRTEDLETKSARDARDLSHGATDGPQPNVQASAPPSDAVNESAPRKGGGCAGCAEAPASGRTMAGPALALAGLVLLRLRRSRRQRASARCERDG